MSVIKCFNDKCPHYTLEEVDHCSRPLQKCFNAIIREGGKSKRFYYDELMSNGCACGKAKKRKQSFCYFDFKSLPDDMQKALYRPIGNGYEEAYDEAVAYLEMNVW